MFGDINYSQQLLISILKKTMWAKCGSNKQSKKNQVSSQKGNLQLGIANIAKQIMQISEQLANNNDGLSKFCLMEMQNKKINAQAKQINGLYQIQKIDMKQNINQYFARTKSKQVQKLQYTYLKIQNYLYIFNHCFIPSSQMEITFILSSVKIQCIISYIQLCISENKIIRSLMPVKLWLKIKHLFSLLWGNSIYQLLSNDNLVLFPEQKAGSFDFQSSSLIFKKNMWYYDSYNVYLTIKGSKYSVKGAGVFDDEIAYTAWKKDIIDEPQYCRIIDKTFKNNSIWGEDQGQSLFTINNQCNHYITSNIQRYKIFSECQIFYLLPKQIIKQLFQCGQIVQCQKGQVIYKSLTNLDKFYVILEGEAKVELEIGYSVQRYPNILTKSQYFSLFSLIKQLPQQKINITVSSDKSLIYSISLWKIKHILGHFVKQINKIASLTIQSQFLSNISINVKLSILLQKMVKFDQMKSRGLSQNTTKKIGYQKIKISNQLWKKLSYKNLEILFATFQQLKKKQQ